MIVSLLEYFYQYPCDKKMNHYDESVEVTVSDEEVDHDAHIPCEQKQIVQDICVASFLVIH